MQAFRPTGATFEISVTGASAATQIVGGADAVRCESPSNTTVYIGFGTGSTTVTVDNAMGMLPGSVETFGVPPGATHIVTIGDAAGTLRVTPGIGV